MGERRFPIAAAKRAAQAYGWHQIVVAVRDPETGRQMVVTWGKTKEDCESTAFVGNEIKRDVLEWPEELCHATPRRTDRRRKDGAS
jgi:hypothetical protein